MLHSRFLAPALGLVAGLLLAAPQAEARTPYDGTWSVQIMTRQGDCDQYNVSLRVADGGISYAGGDGSSASGRVDAQGRVNGALQALGETVSARGRLAGSRGSGTWSGAGCTGTWRAARSG